MRFALFCFISLASGKACCQAGYLPAGYAALTGASRLQADAFSATHHPAALANLNATSIGFFAEQRYLVPGLSNAAVSAGIPVKQQAVGAMLHYLGGPQAQQVSAQLGAAQKLGTEAALGVQVLWHYQGAAGYAPETTVGYALGAQLQLAPQAQAAISATNPHATWRRGGTKPQQATVWRLSLGYDLSQDVFLTATLEKMAGRQAATMAAFQYRLGSKLLCRAGIGTAAGQIYLGCGYVMGYLRLDVFTSVHQQLGFSPGIQLLLQPKPEE